MFIYIEFQDINHVGLMRLCAIMCMRVILHRWFRRATHSREMVRTFAKVGFQFRGTCSSETSTCNTVTYLDLTLLTTDSSPKATSSELDSFKRICTTKFEMNVDLNSILALAEFNSTRTNPPRMIKKKCPQCEDGEELVTTDRLCRTCGENLVECLQVTGEAAIPPTSDTMNFFDLLGDDLRRAITESLAQSHSDRQISTEYLSRLGKVVLDERRGLLFDITLCIGPLSFMGVLASFGPIPSAELVSSIVIGEPEFGDMERLTNSGSCAGAIVLLKRGKVSFAQKALAAMASGAAALVICQTYEIWPFVMTDSANEISKVALNIPVIMISQSDSEIVEKLISSSLDEKKGRSAEKCVTELGSSQVEYLSSKLLCGNFEEECSICQDNMVEGNTALKLTCRHAYHADCVQRWLEKHNTCPLCRNEMPRHKGPQKMSPGGVDQTSNGMPYFN